MQLLLLCLLWWQDGSCRPDSGEHRPEPARRRTPARLISCSTHCLSQWQIRYLPAPRYQDQSENVNDIELNILLCIVIGACHHGIFLLIFIISLLIQCFWSIFRTIMESLLNLSSRSLEDNIQSFGAQTCLDIVSVVSRSRQHKSLLEACNEQILKEVSRACMYLD